MLPEQSSFCTRCRLSLWSQVIAAAGNDPKCELAVMRGASHGVNYSRGSLREEVKALTGGRGVDVAIEAVGGDVFKAALQR